jgi:putative hemolysin
MVDELLIILILILSNGLLSMAEIAIISSKRSRLEVQSKKGSDGARMALELSSKPSRFLSTIQIGITASGILTGILSGKSLIIWSNQLLTDAGTDPNTANWIAFPSVVIVVTFFSLVIGELVPKRIGMHNPERIASSLAPLMNGISKIVSPLIWLLSGTTDAILRIFGIDSHSEEVQVTEEEVKELIAQGTNSGTIEELEQDMMERVLLLGDRSVASLMTNRIEVEWIDVNAATQDILEKIVESNHSLFPVCDDEIDKVVGVLSSKKFLVALQRERLADIRYLMDNARVIPENMKALAALEEFKANKTKIAVVVDEYGSVQGVLTQSDLFESIVAEHDTPDEENEISIIQREENSYLIDALLPFEEFLQYFEIDDVAQEDRTGFHSLGGFILHLSKQIPSTGDRFEWKNYEFEVVDMDVNRIDKLMVTIKDEGAGS